MADYDAYAEAIVDLARGEDALETVEDELLRVARVLEENRDLQKALTDTQVPVGRRMQVVDESLPAAHPVTRTAVSMVVAAGQVRGLSDIAEIVSDISAGERGRELAEVWVAQPISDDRRERLREALERATGKDLEMKVFVDQSVVGGVRARIGDVVIDGSLARRLDQIRARVRT
jgi:F-type H+-transporting ATPase subunit delta